VSREENLKRLEALGVVRGSDGKFAPKDAATPVVPAIGAEDGDYEDPSSLIPDTTHLSVFADPAVKPVVPVGPVHEDPNSKHDWTKRMADAQEAQRKLEAARLDQRKDLQRMEQIKAETENLLKQLQEAKAPVAPVAPAPTVPTGDKIAALKAAYPEMAEALEELTQGIINSTVQPHIKTIESMREKQEEAARLATENAVTAKTKEIGAAVLVVHSDASELYSSDDFQNYVQGLPPAFRSLAIDAIYQNTAAYEPEDIISVIDGFKASRVTKPQARPNVAPNLSPANALQTAPGSPAQGAVVQPFSQAELPQFRAYMADASSQGERDHLMARLRATLPPSQ